MKICFVSTMTGIPWGGSEVLWSQTARRALEEGHQVATVTYRWPSPPEPLRQLQARGARLFHRAMNRDHRAVRILEQTVYPLPRLIRWRPDVICFSQGSAYDLVRHNLDLVRFQERCGAPFVVVFQYTSDLHIPPPGVRPRAVDFFQRAQELVFVSENNRRALERQLAVNLANGRVVRNPVNLPCLDAIPWPDAAVVQLATVARLEASYKGQDILLEVLSEPAWKARAWRLHLYGEGRDGTYLRALADHFGLHDRVEFHGQVADVPSIWAANQLLVLPSRSEGTPLALVEAMICGRPALVTNVGGNLEWIDEPQTGFIAEAATARALGAALERAWQARADWPAIGTRARTRALAQYDPAPEQTLLRLLIDAAAEGVTERK